jgi:hypothetical protein
VWGFSNADIQLTVSIWVLKSTHPADCQHVESQSQTVHGQSEFGKPLRCYLGSQGAWGFLGCPWDPRIRETYLQMSVTWQNNADEWTGQTTHLGMNEEVYDAELFAMEQAIR